MARDRIQRDHRGGLLRAALPGLALLLLASLPPVRADTREMRIAVVTSRAIGPYEEAVDGFRAQIHASLPNAAITVYDLNGNVALGPAMAAEITSKSFSLVQLVGTEAYKAISPYLHGVPMIISMVYDPETEFGLDPARDPQTYGVRLRVPIARQLEVVKSFCPLVRRVSYIYSGGSALPRSEVDDAADQGIRLEGIPIADLGQLEKALDQARTRSDAFLMVLDPNIYTRTTTENVLLYFMRAKVPVFSFSPNYVKAGALLSVSASYQDNGATAARLAVDLLTGNPVREHFVPTREIRMDWNTRAAEALGLELSAANRARCTELFGS